MTTKDFDKLNLKLFGLDKPKSERFTADDYREALKRTIEDAIGTLNEVENVKFSEITHAHEMLSKLRERMNGAYKHYV